MNTTFGSSVHSGGAPANMFHADAPAPFRCLSHDVLEAREGGGALTLFGLPSLAVGVFMFLAGIRVVPMENASGTSDWIYAVLTVAGAVFAGVGGTLVFGRKWTRIDRSTRTIQRLKGLLVPMQREVESLSGYDLVEIRHDPGDSDSAETFPVLLKANNGHQIPLADARDYAAAYRLAVYVAEFLRCSLEDATTSNARRLSADQVRTCLHEQLKGGESSVDSAPRPFSLRSHIEQSSGNLRITVPIERPRTWTMLLKLLPIAVAVYITPSITEFLDKSQTPLVVQQVFFFFLYFFLVALPLLRVGTALLKARVCFTRLTVNRAELSIAVRGLCGTRTSGVNLADVVDVDLRSRATRVELSERAGRKWYEKRGTQPDATRALSPGLKQFVLFLARLVPSEGVIIKTRSGLLDFGAGLPDEEVAYIRFLLREQIRRS